MSEDLVFHTVQGTPLDGLTAAVAAGASKLTVCTRDGELLGTVTIGEVRPPLITLGPLVCDWPPDTIAWCQRCDRPIRHGRPYEQVPNDRGGSWAGFRHRVCLEVVR